MKAAPKARLRDRQFTRSQRQSLKVSLLSCSLSGRHILLFVFQLKKVQAATFYAPVCSYLPSRDANNAKAT